MFALQGGRELRRQMRKAGTDLGALKDANAAVGGVVVAAAQGMVPVRSGRLAGTIRASRRATGVSVSAGRAAVPYAGPIHWGWPARNIAAQPFLADAGKRTEPTWTAIYFAALDRIADSIKGDR